VTHSLQITESCIRQIGKTLQDVLVTGKLNSTEINVWPIKFDAMAKSPVLHSLKLKSRCTKLPFVFIVEKCFCKNYEKQPLGF
jgi:hypothetical protein